MNGEDTVKQYLDDISRINERVAKLQTAKKKRQVFIANYYLSPFKVGETVLCTVPLGMIPNERKCVIELVGMTLYARPYGNRGKLDKRHFLIAPVQDTDYSKYFKKVGDESV